jgi:hypothetical protein
MNNKDNNGIYSGDESLLTSDTMDSLSGGDGDPLTNPKIKVMKKIKKIYQKKKG